MPSVRLELPELRQREPIRHSGNIVGNRDGLGALITLETASGTRSWLTRTGSSYFSQSQVAPIFGLAAEETVDKLTVLWPSGAISLDTAVAANQRVRIVEEN